MFVGYAASNGISVPANAGCSCPGELLTFTCTVMGGGVTLWRGTAFNCPSNNEIILRHSQYASGGSGASGECNGGAITGQGSRNVVNSNFSSQLNITVSAALNRRSVECAYNDGQQTSRIGLSTLTVITGNRVTMLKLVAIPYYGLLSRACTQGVKQSACRLSVVTTKIAR